VQTVSIPTSGGRRAVQSASPASEGEAVGVVRRALTSQVVVHAPTLALARDLKRAGPKTPKWAFFGKKCFIGPPDAARRELSNGPLFDLWR
jgi:hypothetical protein